MIWADRLTAKWSEIKFCSEIDHKWYGNKIDHKVTICGTAGSISILC